MPLLTVTFPEAVLKVRVPPSSTRLLAMVCTLALLFTTSPVKLIVLPFKVNTPAFALNTIPVNWELFAKSL